ncbi:cytochrome c peroxidase [Candidatus Vondammii sp. HM_W22]|uniref:cytochrome c peroxidase n=1 Tax=Candidatus Vondammii sp. HM_W22 TaxID=2687299 RepID=UPI00403DE48D
MISGRQCCAIVWAGTKKTAIGKHLLFDPILSKDRITSCASCHDLKYGGADSRPISLEGLWSEGKYLISYYLC